LRGGLIGNSIAKGPNHLEPAVVADYIRGMKKRKIFFSSKALSSFQAMVNDVQETSLIGAEKTRKAVLDDIRKLAVNPELNSRVAKFEKLPGEYRSLLVWNYRVYFKIESEQIVVMDIILDLGSQVSV